MNIVPMKELRFVPGFFALCCFLLSNRLWELAQQPPDEELVFIPLLWAWWMVFAGVTCVVYAIRLDSILMHALSGAVTVTGFMSRAAVTLIILMQGDDWRTVVALQINILGITYTLLAFATYIIWIRLLRPATTLLRRKG